MSTATSETLREIEIFRQSAETIHKIVGLNVEGMQPGGKSDPAAPGGKLPKLDCGTSGKRL